MKEEVESLQDQLEDAQEAASDAAWEQKVAEAKQEGQSIREAYENLLTLMREGTAGQEGNVAISKARGKPGAVAGLPGHPGSEGISKSHRGRRVICWTSNVSRKIPMA